MTEWEPSVSPKPNAMTFVLGQGDDVRSLLTTAGFAGAVLDPAKKSTIYSLVVEVVGRSTRSGRLTISPTSAEYTTGPRTVRVRIKRDCSLTVTASMTGPYRGRSTSARTGI